MKKFLIVLIAFCTLHFALSTCQAQATTQVLPRQYFVVSNQLLTVSVQKLNTTTSFSTNLFPAYLPGPNVSWPTTLPVGAFTNTYIPFSGAHAIGITAIIYNTNNFVGTSNITFGIFPAYDRTQGTTNGLNSGYGVLFGPNPICTFSVTIQASNTYVFTTNIPTASWEPATSLGYCVTNTTISNLVVTIVQTVAP